MIDKKMANPVARSPLNDTVIQWLDDSVDCMDAETASKLTQARYRALEAQPSVQSILGAKRWLFPAAGLASAAVLALILSLSPPLPEINGAGSVLNDLDVLAAAEELEFFEDIEFYQWLDGELSVVDEAENA